MLVHSPQDSDVQWHQVELLEIPNNQQRSALVEQHQRLFRLTAPFESFAKEVPFPDFQPGQDRPGQMPTTGTESS